MEYTADSCRAMRELTDRLAVLDSRPAFKDFLSSYLRQFLNRAVDAKNFFEDSTVIARENTQVQSLLSRAEEDLIAIMEAFLRKRYPDKQDDFYIKARMLYVITDKVANDIIYVDSAQQKEVYIQCFADEILHFSFNL